MGAGKVGMGKVERWKDGKVRKVGVKNVSVGKVGVSNNSMERVWYSLDGNG